MAVCYDRLFCLMDDKKVTTTQLVKKTGFSATIVTRLKRNQYISLESIESICRVMGCTVNDMLEFTEIDK